MEDYEGFLSALTVERFGGAARQLGASRLLLRVEEAAQVLGVGRTRVYELIGSGALRSVKIGGSRRVPAAALHEYVEPLTNES